MFWDQAWLAFSLFFENQEYLSATLLAIVALAALPRKKILFESAILIGILSTALKLFFHQARPCLTQAALVACPPDFGFPSGHAALSGLLLVGSLGSPWALLFVPLSLLVSYSRIYLGVHTPEQVIAGLALAVTVYLMVWRMNAEADKK